MDDFICHKNYYELLGVSTNADEITLHKAFRTLSKSFHPDTTTLPPDVATLRFQEVRKAYELLADPEQRKIYDARLNAESSFEKPLDKDIFIAKSGGVQNINNVEIRRPLSGGELFSLMLLVGALLLSLLLGLVFASAQGRDLQVLPSWLLVEESIEQSKSKEINNDNSSSLSDSTKSALIRSFGVLA